MNSGAVAGLPRTFRAVVGPGTRLVALVAVAVRALYLAEHARSAFFTVPVLDGRWFDVFARALAAGTVPPGLATGFRPVLYPLLLSPLYRLLGDGGMVAAQVLQHALGVATAVAVASLARRVFASEAAAVAAGLLYALAPVPLFFEGELLVESVFCAAVAALLLAALEAERRRSARWAAAAGIALGVAAQLRPNVLLLAIALPWLLGRQRRRLVAFTGSAAGALLLLAALERPWVGAFRPLPEAGGVNLYLGNERGADGLVPRQDFAVVHADDYRDSVELFAEAAYRRHLDDRGEPSARPLAGGELTRYWLARTAREAAADPLGRLELLARKALVLLWNGEVPNNKSFAFVAAEESLLLRALPMRFAPLLALALVGFVDSRRSPARDWTLAFAITHAAGVVLFFVADRYRLPLYLPVAVFAGGGVAAIGAALRTRAPRRLLAAAGLVALGLLVSAVDWTGARGDLPGVERDLYFRSIAHLELGEAAAAVADARGAIAADPRDPHLRTQLGVAALADGDLDLAATALADARRLAPGEPRVLNALGLLAERRGEPDAALGAYREALDRAPAFVPARINAAWLELRRGRLEAARELAAGLPASAPETAQLLLLRARLAAAAGRSDEARRLRADAYRRAPDAAAALEAELSGPSTSRR